MDRLLIETDAPYLAPVPFRGKRNEPAFVLETARILAEVKQVSLEDGRRCTTANLLNGCSTRLARRRNDSPQPWSRPNQDPSKSITGRV